VVRILTHNVTIFTAVIVLVAAGVYYVNLGKDAKPPKAGDLSLVQLNELVNNVHVDKATADSVANAKQRAHDQAVATQKALEQQAVHDAKVRAELKAKAEASRKAAQLRSNATNPDGNKALGKQMNQLKGWGQCWPSLLQMWTNESGWDQTASNPGSGAYGIPQALPGDKMSSVGSDWRTSSATQIAWGLGYIQERYVDPCQAWSFWQAHQWY
jgi:hypothetical protein